MSRPDLDWGTRRRRLTESQAAPATVELDSAEPFEESELRLREVIRGWRHELAAKKGVPAYVIFGNRTLDDLVRRRPEDPGGLAAVHGFGPTRIERYGEDLLRLMTGHTDDA